MEGAQRVHRWCVESTWSVHRGCVEGAQRAVVGTCSQLKTPLDVWRVCRWCTDGVWRVHGVCTEGVWRVHRGLWWGYVAN